MGLLKSGTAIGGGMLPVTERTAEVGVREFAGVLSPVNAAFGHEHICRRNRRVRHRCRGHAEFWSSVPMADCSPGGLCCCGHCQPEAYHNATSENK